MSLSEKLAELKKKKELENNESSTELPELENDEKSIETVELKSEKEVIKPQIKHVCKKCNDDKNVVKYNKSYYCEKCLKAIKIERKLKRESAENNQKHIIISPRPLTSIYRGMKKIDLKKAMIKLLNEKYDNIPMDWMRAEYLNLIMISNVGENL